MNSGKLRHRVTVEGLTETQDASGDVVKSYTVLGSVWAAIEPLSGREYFQAQQVVSEATSRIRLRYLPGVVPSSRVLFGSRVFDVLHVANPEERNVELLLLCKELQ